MVSGGHCARRVDDLKFQPNNRKKELREMPVPVEYRLERGRIFSVCGRIRMIIESSRIFIRREAKECDNCRK